jgi:hypothetical protein
VRRRRRSPDPAWTARDDVLRYTCMLADELAVGLSRPVASAAQVAAPFPTTLGEQQPLWASGSYTLHAWRAPGDGSWQANRTLAFGTGALGGGLVLGMLVGEMIGNSRARRAAEAAAIPRWMQIGHGTLYLGHRGFYRYTPQLLAPCEWADITAATMTGAGAVRISGNSTDGPPGTWLLCSVWAELLFVTWALTRHPRHPQLIDGQWLPTGWLDHANRPATNDLADKALRSRFWSRSPVRYAAAAHIPRHRPLT